MELKQPKTYISYQNFEGSSSLRFKNYKFSSFDVKESLISESEFSDNRCKGTIECTEKASVDEEIIH
jgi:hypothetical protein